MAKILKREILLVREKLSKGAIFQKNQAQHETKAENLLTELRIRFKTLSKKYGVNLEELGDYQILDLQQEKSMDLEFNEILDKVTELSSLAHLVGEKMCATIDKVRKTRDKLVSKREVFSDTLRKIMIERDITLEKIKQASDMPIEIPRFTGYDSKMDFFTFRSEFRKLIEPKIRKKLWPDYVIF